MTKYDAIIVGARCAGSPTAMLLARKGYRVLVVDKARFPSDTISTHVVHPLGMAALARWGLRDRVVTSGCPPIHHYSFDFGPFTIRGMPGTDDTQLAYCPRRTVLDKLLVNAAADAGAEIREGFSVDGLVFEDDRVVGIQGHTKDGTRTSERASIVVGADGRHSRVADAVAAVSYNDKPALLCGYYTYYSGVPMDGTFETFIRPARGMAAAPTHDGLTLVIAGWPITEFEANKKDVEGNFLRTLELAPELAERLRAGRREERIAGATVANYFRKPYGAGWALVGDAGYNRDFITAQGITDAFRDAERCASALDEALRRPPAFETVMASYQRARDERVTAIYELTTQLAMLEPPPAEMQQLFAAVAANQASSNAFVRMQAGGLSPTEFFAPEHVAAIMAAGSRPD